MREREKESKIRGIFSLHRYATAVLEGLIIPLTECEKTCIYIVKYTNLLRKRLAIIFSTL